MCTQHFGSVATNTVRNFKPEQLPLLLLISRSRSINEVVDVIHGECAPPLVVESRADKTFRSSKLQIAALH